VTKEEDKQPVPCAGKYVDRIQHRELTADERIQVGEAKKAKYDQWAVWFEAQMVAAMAEQFIAQRDRIIANLDPARIGKSYGKKVRGKQPVYSRKDWLQDLIDWAAAAESFGAAIEPTIHATLLQAGRDAMQDIGIDAGQFDPFTPAIIEYFHDRSAKIANDVTDETEKQLRASLSEGVIAGGSTYELRARVEAVMGNASTMRADRIARTEVSRAQGYGDLQAWTQSGAVSGKEWYTARDEMVCPFCNAMDGRVAKLNEDFFTKGDSQTVNGKTQHYNYDAVPSPPLHVNCRCTLLPVR
jgi:SPP1 gp7 family putative phage head morphogenesis protein